MDFINDKTNPKSFQVREVLEDWDSGSKLFFADCKDDLLYAQGLVSMTAKHCEGACS